MSNTAQRLGADRDIVEWIEKQERQLTYSELAAACLAQLGPTVRGQPARSAIVPRGVV